jgi:hypothetical protein
VKGLLAVLVLLVVAPAAQADGPLNGLRWLPSDYLIDEVCSLEGGELVECRVIAYRTLGGRLLERPSWMTGGRRAVPKERVRRGNVRVKVGRLTSRTLTSTTSSGTSAPDAATKGRTASAQGHAQR